MKKRINFYRQYWRVFVYLGILFAVANYIGVACGRSGGDGPQAGPQVHPTNSLGTYCAGPQSYSGGLTVSGVAQFNVRQSSSSGLGAEVLGGNIRFAEVQILDESNNVIQCGETDTNGAFSLVVPRNHSLTLKVNARSQNTHVNATVLDSPNSDNGYSIVQTFSSSNSSPNLNVGTLTASAKPDSSGNILGGAFNILFNILRANESLRYYICGIDNNITCPNFTVAPMVTAYWKAGVNPYTYFGGDPNSGLSFYIVGSDKLYILGGIGGDVDHQDTDHFDDAVISHEYGHFIEDHYAKTDSPGGSHDGDHILDPRLTWGEGWANFFSSAMRASQIYRDTYGTIDGATGCFFNYDIDKNSNFGQVGGARDLASVSGEGNFHEFAITRALWDGVDPIRNTPGGPLVGSNGGSADDNPTDNVDNSGSPSTFFNYWQTFRSFQNPALHFRTIGLFMQNDNDPILKASTNLSAQKINANLNDYGKPLPLTTGSGCSGTTIAITANDPASCMIGGQQICVRGNLNSCCSNQFASNDFYDVNFDGTNPSTIFITNVSGPAQLDLYLYKDGYTFGNQLDMATLNLSTLAAGQSKSISLAGLPAGHYLLNVNVFTATGNPGTTNYKLSVNSLANQVCP